MLNQIKKGVILTTIFLASVVTPSLAAPQSVQLEAETSISNGGEKFVINSSMFYGNKKIRIDSEVKASNPASMPAGFGKTSMVFDSDKNVAYMMTPQTKTALKMDMKTMQQMQGGNPGASNMTSKMMSDPGEIKSELQKQGGKMVGAETVLGHLCDIWQAPMKMPTQQGTTENATVKIWIANKINIPLKMEATSTAKGKFMTYIAKSVKTDAKFDPATFEVPKGYQITDFSQMMNQQKKQGH